MKPISRWLLWALIAVGAAAAWFGCAHFKKDPWYPLAASAHVKVVNRLDHGCLVEVSDLKREPVALGVVLAHDSATWRLPYADQKVAVIACRYDPQFIDVDGPSTWTVIINPKDE